MKYSTKYESENMARAKGMSLNVSFKQSVEVCRMIRNKKYSAAATLLQNVQEMKEPVAYRKFNRGGVGHRKGLIGPGRFPIKTSKSILEILKSAYSNADQKGLDTESLKVCSAVAKKGPKTMKYGRIQGRRTKRTHIEIMLRSSGVSKKPAEKSRTKKTEEKKSFTDLRVKPAGQDSSTKNQKEQGKTETKKPEPSANAETESNKQEKSVNKKTPAKESAKPAQKVKNQEKDSKTNNDKKSGENKK